MTTLREVEEFLATRGLRLRKAVRVGRRWIIEASGEGLSLAGSGHDLREAVENLIEVAGKRPRKRSRYTE